MKNTKEALAKPHKASATRKRGPYKSQSDANCRAAACGVPRGFAGASKDLWPDFHTVESIIAEWARNDNRIRVDIAGRSRAQRPVYAVTLTDRDVPDEEKQHALFSAQHAGIEHSATTTLLALMRWLLSDCEKVRDTLRRQVITCLPIMDPDGYHAVRKGPDFSFSRINRAWSMKGVENPETAPEAAALQEIIDAFQPDVYLDIHGVSLDFPEHAMVESSAASPGRTSTRPFHKGLTRLMDRAALRAGFPSDFQEEDREVLFPGPATENMGTKTWPASDAWSSGLYAYNHYHTLMGVMEVTWAQSGLARLKRLLQVGNERWPGEYYPGYPNRVVGGCGAAGYNATVTAYGTTAGQIRRSRVELWEKHGQFALAGTDPNILGKAVSAFTLSGQARDCWLGEDRPGRTMAEFIAGLRECPAVNSDYIAGFLQNWHAGQNFPEPCLPVKKGMAVEKNSSGGEEPPRHGIAFRLRLPLRDAKIKDLRLNGHRLKKSADDGYQVWKARGFTHLQVNVSPQKIRSDLPYLITCEYDPPPDYADWHRW